MLGGPLVLADAWREAASTGVRAAHVEERGSSGCAPTHLSECLICRHLSTLDRPEPRAHLPAPTVAAGEAGAFHTGIPGSAELLRSALPRAPPYA